MCRPVSTVEEAELLRAMRRICNVGGRPGAESPLMHFECGLQPIRHNLPACGASGKTGRSEIVEQHFNALSGEGGSPLRARPSKNWNRVQATDKTGSFRLCSTEASSDGSI